MFKRNERINNIPINGVFERITFPIDDWEWRDLCSWAGPVFELGFHFTAQLNVKTKQPVAASGVCVMGPWGSFEKNLGELFLVSGEALINQPNSQ